jgi:hypothetical protein
VGNEKLPGGSGHIKKPRGLISVFLSKFSKAKPLCWEPTGIVISHTTLILLVNFTTTLMKNSMLQKIIYPIREFQSKSVIHKKGIFKIKYRETA